MDICARLQFRFLVAGLLMVCAGCTSNHNGHDLANGGASVEGTPSTEPEEGPVDAQGVAIERHREQVLTSKYGDYPFRAVFMRIHPLTRVLVQPSDEGPSRVIEARLEFSDQFGDTTKAFGNLRFELYPKPAGGSRALSESDLLVQWEPEFSRIRVNATHFDSVTRTYLYRLEIEDGLNIPSECVLVAHVKSFKDELEARVDITVPQGANGS